MPDATAPAANAAASAPQASVLTSDIQREAARLQVRLHPESAAGVISRNLFRFASPTPREIAAPEALPNAAPVSAAVAAPIPRPQLSLDGVATDVVDGQEQRTAILHTDGGVVLAREGDLVSGQYRVVRVAPDAAELMNVSSGSVVRLGLR